MEAEAGDVIMFPDFYSEHAVVGDLAAGLMRNRLCGPLSPWSARDRAGIVGNWLPRVWPRGVLPNSPREDRARANWYPITLGREPGVVPGDIVVGTRMVLSWFHLPSRASIVSGARCEPPESAARKGERLARPASKSWLNCGAGAYRQTVTMYRSILRPGEIICSLLIEKFGRLPCFHNHLVWQARRHQ